MQNQRKPVQTKKSTGTSWEQVAGWYDELLESGEGTYQRELILPNTLRLLALKKGERVLDLACGQGFFSREFGKTGADVTGVDISPKLIALANERTSSGIRFGVANAERLTFLRDAEFDAAACILAIQNMKNPAGVCAEMSRVLKSGGRMLIVLNHPAFRIPKRSAWGYDEAKKIQFRREDEYISESSAEIVMHPGSAPSSTTPSFHRPLQFYFKALYKAGFLVRRLEEWTSQKKSEPGPRAAAENKARREFPLFLALEVLKS